MTLNHSNPGTKWSLLPLVLLLLIAVTGFVLKKNATNENQNVSQTIFKVTFDGNEYTVVEGKELKIDESTISIELADFKYFDTEYVSFSYPSGFTYEEEKEEEKIDGYTNYTLDGNDFVVMYFEVDGLLGVDDFITEIVKQFGKRNCTVNSRSLKLGDKTLKGKRIDVKLVGQHLTYDLYSVVKSDEKSVLIGLQDILDEADNASDESVQAIDLLDRTIEYHEE
jgi:hypothetical protein